MEYPFFVLTDLSQSVKLLARVTQVTRGGEIMPKQPIPKTTTLEANAYLDGMFTDFKSEIERYQEFTTHMMHLEARLGLSEKRIALTRDELNLALTTCEGGPDQARLAQFHKLSERVRFVGMRLVDACTIVLKKHGRLTPEKLLDAINEGTFRFRTNAPLREIHAALLRQPNVDRRGNCYIWTGPKELPVAAEPKPSLPVAAHVTKESSGEGVKPN
jgi:hypothetical protein